MSENIILTGFMGTGKSTVGYELARQMMRPFVDMDVLIETRTGKTVERIFQEDGEAAFRELESQVCQELSQKSRLVIATGGGALLNDENLRIMEASGMVICLTASVEEIHRRVDGSAQPVRPLIETSDRFSEIKHLLKLRQHAYQAMPWHLNTTGHSLDEVVRRIKLISQVARLEVKNPQGAYQILIGHGLLEQCGDVLRQAGLAGGVQTAVVTNSLVESLYANIVLRNLAASNFSTSVCLMPDGEEYKNLQTVSSLYDQFLINSLQRRDAVVALGGGVTGDTAGFAAATYLRGVDFIQLPTTLLSMVDSSVGGKTGVDLPQGKNLVGAFKQPRVVLMDPEVLKTLPAAELRSGLAEVIKHGVIADPGLVSLLENNPGRWEIFWQETSAVELIARAVRVKMVIVEADPYESGNRALLNLGHTLGHALEKLSGYRVRHGEGVSIGMSAAVRLSAAMGYASAELVDRLETLLKNWGLPVRLPKFETREILMAMDTDKKKQGKTQRWILPHALGDVGIHEDVPEDALIKILNEMEGE